MGHLSRRVNALEQIAEEVRTRPYRRMAADHDIPFDELMHEVRRVRALVERLRADGLSMRQICERFAEEEGLSADAIEAESEKFARYYE